MASSSSIHKRQSLDSLDKPKHISTTLKQRIDDIALLPPTDAVTALTALTPGLKNSLSYTGERVITHEAYEGPANFTKLCKIFLALGTRCSDENASLQTRLQHYELHKSFEKLFRESNKQVKNSKVAWFFTEMRQFSFACAHCIGAPHSVIPHGDRKDNALFFKENVYKSIFGDQESVGSMSWWEPELKVMHRKLLASEDQVKEAIVREEGGQKEVKQQEGAAVGA